MVQERTTRALIRAGAHIAPRCLDPREAADALASTSGVVAVAKAGAWIPLPRRVPELPPEGTWLAAGALLGDAKWERALARCGGDFSRLRWWDSAPPAPPAMLLSPAAARHFSGLWKKLGYQKAWRAILRAGARVVHLPELDSHLSESLRVIQLVTSIQVGGAERVALDLAARLPERGVASLLVTLCKQTRQSFSPPRELLDLSRFRSDPARAAAEVENAALAFGADAIHAHLIRAEEAAALRSRGLPVMLHIHNQLQGWPPDYTELSPHAATLLVACAQSVERELPAMATRTTWNGISFTPAQATHDAAFTVVSLANPRRQKRLERIPEIARLTAGLLAPRPVRFIIAGASEAYSADSAEALAALDAAIEAHGAAELIERPGIITDTADLLARADALLSVSAFEGLSLAHLEALAAGVPVVATDVGGTSEIAAQSEAMRLLPVDAPAAEFARALVGCKRGTATLPASFSLRKMVERSAWLAAATARRASRGKGDGLWLVANNFSTGGAQSSARRLLLALRERGVKVRAAVIQEQPQFPTPGRRALVAAGIPVLAVPADGHEMLLDAIERDPPQAVFFWNVITSWKVLLADALLDMRIFDISPGEMLFSSLDRFFERPPTGLPYCVASDYGRRLAGMVVKYHSEAARATSLGCPVVVIRNGVPLLPLPDRAEKGVLVFGTAARLSPDKKLGDLLAAVRHAAPELPPFVLRIAGGPEGDFPHHGEELRGLAAGLPVEWLGEVSDMPAFLASLDIFLMISEPAGCPNATLEAAASGLPIIATDHGGAREQVLDGLTGALVPRSDAGAFSKALVRLATSAPLRSAMGRAAREHIGKEFRMERMAYAYAALIYDKADGCD